MTEKKLTVNDCFQRLFDVEAYICKAEDYFKTKKDEPTCQIYSGDAPVPISDVLGGIGNYVAMTIDYLDHASGVLKQYDSDSEVEDERRTPS